MSMEWTKEGAPKQRFRGYWAATFPRWTGPIEISTREPQAKP